MPHSISLSKLSWSTPDGHCLFNDLNLSFNTVRTGLVGRNGVGKSTILNLIAGALEPRSGSVTANCKLAYMRQITQTSSDETVADLFGLHDALTLLRKAEAGLASAEELVEADWTFETRLSACLARFGLEAEAETPLAALSGGQQTRAALARLVFDAPDFLLLDEPTNNLDQQGRGLVTEFLTEWQAGAIVISHDRALLDRMDMIVELTSLGATRYGGNYRQYRAQKALELAAAEHNLARAERHLSEAGQKAQKRAARQAKRNKAGRRKRSKGDMPKLVLNEMKERSEATSAAATRLSDDRIKQAQEEATTAQEKIERLKPLSMDLSSTGLPRGRTVLELQDLTAGYKPDTPVIRGFNLTLTGPERIAISGPNGSGKSTLLSAISGNLPPLGGILRVQVEIGLLDQQVSLLDPDLSIRDNFKILDPGNTENSTRAALARFKFRADAATQLVGNLSGGERLRAGLACMLGTSMPPGLLILDEPTNHLDLDAIEALEAALQRYDGAILVASHDQQFLQAIGVSRKIELGKDTHSRSKQ